ATLEKLGSLHGLFLLLHCKEEHPMNCRLSASNEKEIDVKFAGQQLSTTLILLSGAGSGEEFFTFHIEEGEGCAIPGTFKVTGKQKAETPTGATGKLEQEIVAKKSGSGGLKLAGGTASLSNAMKNVHLGGANLGTNWLVMEGV